jgi:large subunit ribosomal protein L23
MNSFDIIKTVRISEKGAMQAERFNQYTVVADRRANKIEIGKAIGELFKVKVVRVNTSNVRGKARRQSTKHAGREANWKKAIITLKKGEKINLT